MAIPPRRIRQLPAALPPKGTDVFPISQIGPDGLATTRAMNRDQFQEDLIKVINDARQEFVNTANQEHQELRAADAFLQQQLDENYTVDSNMETVIAMLQQQMADGDAGKNAFELWQELPGNGDKTIEDYFGWMQGATGAQGPQGEQGLTGAQGLPGPIGPAGADGVQGPTGPAGPAGPQGEVGPIGPAGPKGETGDVGPVGPMGPSGKGDKGDKGEKGEKGEAGTQGLQGPSGGKGDTGSTGLTGPQGDTGPAGPVGPQGPQGATGAAGPAGLGTITPGTSARALGTAFRPSTTKATLCTYSVKVQVTNPLLVGTSTATVKLLSDASATPTTERCRAEATSGVGVSVTLALTTSNTSTLSYIVPAGHYVLLQASGTGTHVESIVAQTEEALG